ncbi:MAG: hypothetical protein KGZ63_00050 [Clostridiales bacterium]|nr:hypothetical protein [Clostridiales bacterium]
MPNVLALIREGNIDLAVNTPTYGKNMTSTGYQVRRTCVEFKIPCLTSVDTTAAFFDILVQRGQGNLSPAVCSLQEYLAAKEV